MPFLKYKNKRKGSRIQIARLQNGRTTTSFKSGPNRMHDATNSKTLASCSTDTTFDIQEHSSCAFLLSGDVVNKPKKTYERSKEKELEKWNLVNDDLCANYAKKYEMILEKTKCDFCEVNLLNSSIWCPECGPISVYCHGCAVTVHKNMAFHSPVEITVSIWFCVT